VWGVPKRWGLARIALRSATGSLAGAGVLLLVSALTFHALSAWEDVENAFAFFVGCTLVITADGWRRARKSAR
jgi:hypothetical protein